MFFLIVKNMNIRIEDINLDRQDDYLLSNSFERESYLKKALESHASVKFILFNNFKQFHSYLFADKRGALEVEIPINDIDINNIIDSNARFGFIMDGVQIIFETKIEHLEKNSPTIAVLKLKHPTKMWRFQRRNTFRAKVPYSSEIKITLDVNNVELKNLHLINLSIGGASVIINDPNNLLSDRSDFDEAVLHLPTATSDYIVKARIRHKKPMTIDMFPESMIYHINYGSETNWLKLGVEFEQVPMHVEQAIIYCVNMLSQKSIH